MRPQRRARHSHPRSHNGLTPTVAQLRHDLDAIVRSAIAGVDAGLLVRRALADADISGALHRAVDVRVVAAGKASAVMLSALAGTTSLTPRRVVGVGPAPHSVEGPARPAALPHNTEWVSGGHPLPNDGSVIAARRALETARECTNADLLLVLLSGGGSALMALPAEGISLDDKQQTARTLMDHSADIYELNTVRKHLSAIKGGQLAAAAGGPVLTLAVSDVVGDDLSVIASGPTVADDSTYAQALDVLERRGGHAMYPAAVVERLRRGADGLIPETPKSGDPGLARATARVIGAQRGAIEAAQRAAEARGYHVYVVDDPVTGEARDAAVAHVDRLRAAMNTSPRPLCVVSSGETTVTVRGSGRGGRNQEFTLALGRALGRVRADVAAASVGTDGIDGPTDAAGAVIDATTFARATALGLPAAESYLDNNNTYAFFEALGDLIKTGPTCTNVGDLQVVLIA